MNKKKKTKFSKIDKLVTGAIIGTAVASMVGLSKTKKGKEMTEEVKKKSSGFFGKINKFFGKTMIFFMNIFKRKKKK